MSSPIRQSLVRTRCRFCAHNSLIRKSFRWDNLATRVGKLNYFPTRWEVETDTLPETTKLHLQNFDGRKGRPIFMGYVSFRDRKSFVIDGTTSSQLVMVALGWKAQIHRSKFADETSSKLWKHVQCLHEVTVDGQPGFTAFLVTLQNHWY